LLDATRLRKHGLPTVALVWDIFERAAKAMASLQGVPDLPIVVVPQVLVGETDAHQRAKGTGAAAHVLAGWAASSLGP
jgi:hypothetical protein